MNIIDSELWSKSNASTKTPSVVVENKTDVAATYLTEMSAHDMLARTGHQSAVKSLSTGGTLDCRSDFTVLCFDLFETCTLRTS